MSSQHWILSFHLSPRYSTDISWTLNDVREKDLVRLTLFLLKNVPYFYQTYGTLALLLWTIRLLCNMVSPLPYNNHLRGSSFFFFFVFITFHADDTFHQRQQLTLCRTTWMSFGGTWLSTCLMSLGSASHPVKKKKTSEVHSRWSCPLEVSLFPAIERVGSNSPDWALGSVQAAAVNEPWCSLLCHAGVSGSTYTSLLFHLPMFLHGIRQGELRIRLALRNQQHRSAPCIV